MKCEITENCPSIKREIPFYQVKYKEVLYNIWEGKSNPDMYVVSGQSQYTHYNPDGIVSADMEYDNVLKSLWEDNRVRILEDCLMDNKLALWLRDHYS